MNVLEFTGFGMFGSAIAAAYTASLAHNTRLYLSPDRIARALFMHVSRLVLLAAVLVFLARAGGHAFLVAVACFAVTQGLLVAWSRRSQ